MTELVVIPTYQEIENLESIVGRVRASVPGAHVLVVDDASPDGTGELADRLSAADDHVHVLHHGQEKAGLGAAYIAGMRWGLEARAPRFDVLLEMDADGSHRPEQIPDLLREVDRGAGLAIGSRWVRGGRVVDWPLSRLAISRIGNYYTRALIGLGIHDVTAGFRAYSRQALQAIDLAAVASHGYCFQVDMAWRVIQAGFPVREVPIVFAERRLGRSKMSPEIVREALVRVTQWGLAHRRDQLLRGIRSVTAAPPAGARANSRTPR